MKNLLQKTHLRALMLVVLMLCGVGTTWGDTVTFEPSALEGQGTSGTGSAISATIDGITFACNKGFGTTQIRCYANSTITISSTNTITAINFTFSGTSYTGNLNQSYSKLSTKKWEKQLGGQARITKIIVTYSSSASDTREDVDLSFPNNSYTAKIGTAFTTPTLTVEPAAAASEVAFSSSNTDVATVNAETGALTLVAAGTTIITAAISESEKYKDASASYTLEVKKQMVTVDDDGNVIFDFSENGWGFPVGSSNKLVAEGDFSSDSYNVKVAGSSNNGYYFNSDGYLILGKTEAYLILPAFDFDVSRIEVTGTSGASEYVKQNIYVGEEAVSTETTGAKNVTNAYEIASAYQAAGNVYVLKVTSNHNTQISQIKVIKKVVPPVAQIGTQKYETLQAAVDAAQQLGGEQTINLLSDISGETVTIKEVANFKLTIDGQKDASSNYTVDAVIVVDGLRGNGGSTTNGASVTLQNIAFVKTTSTDGIQASHYPHHLTIQDCTYTGFDNDKWFLNASVDGPLYGVTVKNVTVENARLIYANMAEDAVFQNITATNNVKVGFNVKTSGTALIENCQVTTGKYAFRDYTDGYEGTFTLKENTFISTSEASDEGVIVNRGGAVGTAHINVESGTYTGHIKVLNNKEGVLAITGGTFSEPVPESALAEDYICASNEDGTYTVRVGQFIAEVGGVKYESFTEAVAALTEDNNTIILLAAVEDAYTLAEGQTLNVILGENTLTVLAPEGYLLNTSVADGVTTYSYASPVAKIGDTMYASLAEAVAAANEGDVITLLADDSSLADGSEIEINKSLTITGAVADNGEPLYTIFGKATQTGTNDIFITGAGIVTLSNLKVKNFGNDVNTDSKHAPIYVSTHFTGTVNLTNVYVSDFNRGGIFLYGGAFNVENCYIDCANARSGAFTKGIEIKGSANGTIKSTLICNMERNHSDAPAGIEIYGNGSITVDDCTIISDNGDHQSAKATYGIVSQRVGEHDPSGGTLHVKNCLFDCTNACLSVADNDAYGPVNNYSITVDDCDFNNYIATWSATSSITINSGSFCEDVYAESGTIIINGGEFSNFAPDTEESGSIVIYGGTFDAPVPEKYCADGYMPTELGDDLYSVTARPKVAQIGETQYYSLQAAVDAAYEMAGDVTIELIDNIEGYSIIKQKAGLNLTIDGKDKTVAGNIVIDGDGRSNGTETLTIQNIKFEGDGTNFCSGTSSFVEVPSTKTAGTPYYTSKYNYAHNITITDCSFTSTTSDLSMAAIRSTSGAGLYNVTISNSTGTDLHSLAQLTGTTGGTVTNNTVDNSESFINVNGGDGEFTVSGNTFTSAKTDDGYAVRENGSSTAVITLTNNNFTAYRVVQLGKGNSATAGTINIESGNHIGAVHKEDAATGKIAISGGTYSVEPDAEFIVEGYVAAKQGDVYVVIPESDLLAAPIIFHDGGEYEGALKVAMAGQGTIKYTLNGGAEQTYSAPINVSETTTITAWTESNGVKSDEVSKTFTIAAATAGPAVEDKYYTIKNNGNNKYVNVAGRKTVTFVDETATAAGTVIRVKADDKGQVQILRSQGVDIPGYAEKAMNYVPKIVELIVDKLHAEGSGELLGENGLDAIMAKFKESFDYHLYLEEANGGYRIYGRTPSMQPVVDFYAENKANVDAKLPGLEAFINSAIEKVLQKTNGSGASILVPFSLQTVWEKMGSTLTEPVDEASTAKFYEEVLSSEANVWNFAYETAMIYWSKLKAHPKFQENLDKLGDYAKYIDKVENIRPNFKYYIVQKDNQLDFISQGNSELNAAFTTWTLAERTDFSVAFPEENVKNAGKEHYTTLYTDFAYTLPEGVKAYKVTAINETTGVATTEEISGTIPAQTPVLLSTTNEELTQTLTLNVNDAGSAPTDNLLVGPDYLINTYNIKTEQVEGLFNMAKELLGENAYSTYLVEYEHLMMRNSGTVNNKYFFGLDDADLELCSYKNENNEDDCVVRSLSTGDEKLGFYNNWEVKANQAFLVNEKFNPVKLTLKGDVTRDGLVNVNDVAATVDISLNKATPETHSDIYDFDAADADESGDINVTDAIIIVNLSLGKE